MLFVRYSLLKCALELDVKFEDYLGHITGLRLRDFRKLARRSDCPSELCLSTDYEWQLPGGSASRLGLGWHLTCRRGFLQLLPCCVYTNSADGISRWFVVISRSLIAERTGMKRLLDIVVSLIGLICLLPLMLLVAVLIKLDSSGPVFFRQERIGRGFRPFQILKFRTMIDNAQTKGRLITLAQDPRITRVGRILRQTKIDELPQLINVLKGEMSFVGPRPEVRRYVELFRQDYAEILTVRPGITDLASLKYRDEAGLLEKAHNPEEEYVTHVLPDKIRLAKDYLQRSSFLFDLSLIFKTLFKLFDYRLSS
jgi:lipopolysaccharide/colanic/teichoic acid biosynthesis glycosyltransferase